MNLPAFQSFACAAISSGCLMSFSTSARTDALNNWTTTQVSTDSFRLNSVVYGDGRYVAVGGESDVGVIVTSEDGLNWVLRAEGVPPWFLNRLAYGGGRYVAVGRFGSTAMSTNGMNWTYGRLNTFGLSGIDGVSWSALSTGFSGSFVQMGYASGVFVAFVGAFGVYTNVVISINGLDWVERTVKPFYSGATITSGLEITSDGRRFLSIASTTGSTSEVYNAYASISDQIVGLALGNASAPQAILSGLEGRSYRVEYVSSLHASAMNSWQTLTNLILTSSPYLLADPEAPTSMQRYYRAVLLP